MVRTFPPAATTSPLRASWYCTRPVLGETRTRSCNIALIDQRFSFGERLFGLLDVGLRRPQLRLIFGRLAFPCRAHGRVNCAPFRAISVLAPSALPTPQAQNA